MDLKEVNGKLESQKKLLELLANLTGDAGAEFALEVCNFEDILTQIAMSSETITQQQYRELTNVIQQLEKMLKDYLKESNIKLQEE